MKHSSEGFILAATDLSNHLGCHHLTQLNRQVAKGSIPKAGYHDPMMDVLRDRGIEHEQAYVDHLRSLGKQVIDLRGKSREEVVKAMEQGVDVLVQVSLKSGAWQGIADILIKVEGLSRFGNWSYEVQDTKLTQNTKAGTILQLCLYSELLAELQGNEPQFLSVIIPGNDFKPEQYRYADFSAYYRQVRKQFEQIMSGPDQSTYPEPVAHCQICNWWQECDKRRHADDHLSLVAGIQAQQIEGLNKQNIHTLEKFAEEKNLRKPERGELESLERRQEQARIQLDGRRKNAPTYKFLDLEQGRGFHRLPLPNEGDIYLDLEGDGFFPDGGLEYLFGYTTIKPNGIDYHKIWSSNKQEEKEAFSRFMSFVKENWARHPDMHIYHFGHYEPSAIKRLAMFHVIYEEEVDQLARGIRFIDLHRVVKESMLASVETYSLKELEVFFGYIRNLELQKASRARKIVEVALERNEFDKLPEEIIRDLEFYNEDDCKATVSLHQWLLKKHAEAIEEGINIIIPEFKNHDTSETALALQERIQILKDKLFIHLPEEKDNRTDAQKCISLLSNLLDYFGREVKCSYWEYFRVHELETEELYNERKAIAGLNYIEMVSAKKGNSHPIYRYRFPPQEISMETGKSLTEVNGDKIGSVKEIDMDNQLISISIKPGITPESISDVHVDDVITPHALVPSLHSFAEEVAATGIERKGQYLASKDLLFKRGPQFRAGTSLSQKFSDPVEQAIRLVSDLDSSVLAIQGPPGTGKTYTAARMIVDLHRQGKKIGITAVSHKVILNLAKAVHTESLKQNRTVLLYHKPGEKNQQDAEMADIIIEETDKTKLRAALEQGGILCGTAYFWAEEDSKGILDYLFIDEAGQMSLAHALAASRSANNLVLLGDPQQLEQPQKGSHPEGSDIASLSHLLDGHQTMPKDKGLFLETSWRLHPAICQYTSEIFYEGRLKSKPGLENQKITGTGLFDDSGLIYVPAVHNYNQSRADKEVSIIFGIVDSLLCSGYWNDENNESRKLESKDILIVAPFNAQVGALNRALKEMRIGTVDKFQGQEAPVVIYSMTSSTAEDAPRGMNFLYNLNRLNVATSRARCVCILVASPLLFEPECHTIEQMRLANALCRYKEMARVVEV
jgi:uncharacterized protein